jgi:hypothetical protein
MSPLPSTACPRRRGDVLSRQVGGDTILMTGDTSGLVLNATALALWELCDGVTTVEEIINAVKLFFDADPQVIRNDVETTLSELSVAGFLEWVSPVGTG